MTTSNRWRITGTLTTTGNLHIGNADIVPDDQRVPKAGKSGDYVQVSAIVTDANGKPYLPGASLRGALRAWMQDHEADDAILHDLFGSEAGAINEADRAGALTVYGASFLKAAVGKTVQNNAYWNETRATTVETGVAIDRVLGVAAENKLYYQEVVPPGVKFKVALELRSGDETHVKALINALAAFNADTLALGAETHSGKGCMAWNLVKIEHLDAANLKKYATQALQGNPGNLWGMATTCEDIQPESLTSQDEGLRITLKFQSLFCVADPGRASNKKKDHAGKDDPVPDKSPRLTADGRALLPAKSFRGVLRSQAERIARTLGISNICGEGTGKSCKPVHKADDVEKLCPVCQLFGAPGWKSLLHITDFEQDQIANEMTQEFIAIDRFTGAGKDGAKFNFRALVKPTLSGNIMLNQARLSCLKTPGSTLGLLALTLRDLAEGDMRFGLGGSKGYGECCADITGKVAGKDYLVWLTTLTDLTVLGQAGEATPAFVSCANQNSAAFNPVTNAVNNSFHNPYHFVPTPAPKTNLHWLAACQFAKGELGHATHAKYVAKVGDVPVYSGRLICSLTAETPFFVGGIRHAGEPARAEPFRIDGQLVIPASSLRGLISSLVESATGSSLRVLENRVLSHRIPTQGGMALSSLGLVVKGKNQAGVEVWCLRPLTMPLLSKTDGTGTFQPVAPLGEQYPEQLFSGSARLKAYANVVAMGTSPSSKVIRYAQLPTNLVANYNHNKISFTDSAHLRHSSRDHQHSWVLGMGQGEVAVSETPAEGLTPVLTRRIRVPGRDLPHTVKHDLVLPYREGVEQSAKLLPILPHAIERFEQLADERTEDWEKRNGVDTDGLRVQPYHPVGTKRNLDPEKLGRKLRIKSGDIVYWRPSTDGKAVEEISFSAMWRGRVEETLPDGSKQAATTHRFFEKISPELLPFNSKRRHISPAELMFGFTSGETRQTDQDWHAYRGRVRPGFGEAVTAEVGEECLLKILDAPKLPSPNLYFNRGNANGVGTTKPGLKLESHIPNGRKVYLHHPNGRQEHPWKTAKTGDNLKQKVRITPIEADSTFLFHVDFDNLSDWELGTLCYALRPNDKFRHKLGMGKPLGLGTVRIDIKGLFLTDRVKRYREACGQRYQQVWLAEKVDRAAWKKRYPNEADADATENAPSPRELSDSFATSIDKGVTRAIQLLGDPKAVANKVCYPPQVNNATDDESKHFEWFVANDKATNGIQALKPLTKDTTQLPALNKIPR